MAGVAEFIDLLHDVVADGELNFQEIRQIGVWINDNKSVRADWPVNEFYKLLKDALRDGKIDRDEAREIARLIQNVLREWIRKQATEKKPSVEEVVAKSLISFEPGVARIPPIPMNLTIPSHSEDSVSYKIDLSGPSCDCPDFILKRSKLQTGDLSRCCKHIMEAYAKVRPSTGWPSWLDAFLEIGIRPAPDQTWYVANMLGELALMSSASRGWVNLYTRNSSGNMKFGYNLWERRWSYGSEPKYAKSIAEHILQTNRAD